MLRELFGVLEKTFWIRGDCMKSSFAETSRYAQGIASPILAIESRASNALYAQERLDQRIDIFVGIVER